MAIHKPANFCSVAVLQSIERGRLRQFLLQYAGDIIPERAVMPPENPDEEYNFGPLAEALINPSLNTPVELIHALYHLDEMSEERFFDDLHDLAETAGLTNQLGPDPTVADLALLIWLNDREKLLRKHAETSALKSRTFEYFRIQTASAPEFTVPPEVRIQRMRAALISHFESKKRGTDCDVGIFERDGFVWISIAHGLPARREPARVNGCRSSAFFRPDQCDVMLYDKARGEIGIHASSKKEKELYRTELGQCLFEDADIFKSIPKYTLQPLQTDGVNSLACDDVGDGSMEWIVLKEVHLNQGGDYNEIVIRKAEDVFEAIEAKTPGVGLPPDIQITKAKFAIKFMNSRRPRIVTVSVPGTTDCRHESDRPLVDDWLRLRGFILDLPSGRVVSTPTTPPAASVAVPTTEQPSAQAA